MAALSRNKVLSLKLKVNSNVLYKASKLSVLAYVGCSTSRPGTCILRKLSDIENNESNLGEINSI